MKQILFTLLVIILLASVLYAKSSLYPALPFWLSPTTSGPTFVTGDALLLETGVDYLLLEGGTDKLLLE